MTRRFAGGPALISLFLAWLLLIPAPTMATAAQSVGTPAPPRFENSAVSATASAMATMAGGVSFSLTGRTPFPIRSASVRYHPVGQETVYAVPAALPVSAPDGSFSLSLVVDPRQDGLPPGLTLSHAWHLTLEDGTKWSSSVGRVDWIDDRFAWDVVRVDTVEVMIGAEDSSDRRDRIVAEVRRVLPEIERVIGSNATGPIRFWVYDAAADLAGTQTANTEPWIAASSYPGLGVTLAVIPPEATIEIGRLIPHELAHHVLHHAATSPFSAPPLWFDEGLAGWFQTTGTDQFPALVRAAAAEGTLPGVAALASSFPFAVSEANLAYAACWSVMTYVIETWGEAAIPRLAASFAADRTDDQAMLVALGIDQRTLDIQWRVWLGASGESSVASP